MVRYFVRKLSIKNVTSFAVAVIVSAGAALIERVASVTHPCGLSPDTPETMDIEVSVSDKVRIDKPISAIEANAKTI
nr:hypothetical protein [Candidatus Accumulibacter phosphatis]